MLFMVGNKTFSDYHDAKKYEDSLKEKDIQGELDEINQMLDDLSKDYILQSKKLHDIDKEIHKLGKRRDELTGQYKMIFVTI